MNRAIFWFAGADHDLIGRAPVERARYFGVGFAVVLTAVTAFGGMLLVLSMVSPPLVWWYAIIALVWALFVFNLDRSLVANVDYGPLTGDNTGLKPKSSMAGRMLTYGGRLLAAILIALVVSEPVLMQFFAPEIEQELRKLQVSDLSAVSYEVRNSNAFADRKAAGDKALADARKAKRNSDADALRKRKAMDEEINGTGGTGLKGCERICVMKERAYRRAQARADAAGTALERAETTHRKEQAALERDIKAEIDAQRDKVKANGGLLNRERALDAAAAKNPALAARRWIITAMLVMVDLMPVLLKLFGPLTMHDYRLRRRTAREAEAYGRHLMEEHSAQEAERAVRMRRRDVRQAVEERGHRQRLAHTNLEADHADELHRERLQAARVIAKERIQLDLEYDLQEARLRHRHRLVGLTRRIKRTRSGGGSVGAGTTIPYRQEPYGTDDRLVLNDRWVVRGEGPPSGRGGQGETRLGYDKDDPARKVVIKRVRWLGDRDMSSVEFRKATERFEKEIDRHRKVVSDYVAPVVDSGFDSRFGLFIITPLYPDTIFSRLHARMTPDGEFMPTLEWALRITEQVLLGLRDCFEQHALIHLDIKPANIALEANPDQVRIIDFGLAKVVSQEGEITSGVTGATRFYAPPEQLRSSRTNKGAWCSPRADVRAVAATVYEILTGSPPLLREALAAGMLDGSHHIAPDRFPDFIKLHQATLPIRPRLLLPELPEPIDDLVMRWLSPRPGDRAADPGKALEQLRAARAAMPEGADSMWVGPLHVRDQRQDHHQGRSPEGTLDTAGRDDEQGQA
ncbi:DUF4407 domain-containing protein [Nonomuraea rhizosphaerae]|uniref:DUF4407 domain-containing protein n=1 Tax=Nonomuraea rhizosphaerae TaxID=2665663 RepID=UPI001C5D9B06|nr:DUF4407 domain-containing protein [Nonomuraea rhizosphaerae]